MSGAGYSPLSNSSPLNAGREHKQNPEAALKLMYEKILKVLSAEGHISSRSDCVYLKKDIDGATLNAPTLTFCRHFTDAEQIAFREVIDASLDKYFERYSSVPQFTKYQDYTVHLVLNDFILSPEKEILITALPEPKDPCCNIKMCNIL